MLLSISSIQTIESHVVTLHLHSVTYVRTSTKCMHTYCTYVHAFVHLNSTVVLTMYVHRHMYTGLCSYLPLIKLNTYVVYVKLVLIVMRVRSYLRTYVRNHHLTEFMNPVM